MNPKYPIYIVSKNRSESRLTGKTLDSINVPYYMVIEPQDYENYASVMDKSKILVLPFSNHGQGPTAARNWCWEHAIQLGAKRHWVMDDNILHFYRLNRNLRIRVQSGTIFRSAEDFVDRYPNVPLAGLNYRFFVTSNSKRPPYVTNTRIYSCLLIENNSPYRWRGRYNEDTDISLRILKDGLCTIQFNAFLQGKVATQTVKGGNSAEFYDEEGTLPKSQYLADLHPDVSQVVWKYDRWHHYVDYEPFKYNKLIPREDLIKIEGVNNYGMVLVDNVKNDGDLSNDVLCDLPNAGLETITLKPIQQELFNLDYTGA